MTVPASRNAESAARAHQVKARLTRASFNSIQARLMADRLQGKGTTIDNLIAQGLAALGIAIHPADLKPDRRMR